MKILFLSQILPYPPDAGPKVKTWNVLRYLVNSGHEVTLVSFLRTEEERFQSDVKKQGIHLITVPIKRNRIKDIYYWLISNITQRPFLIQRDDLPEMRKLVSEMVKNDHFDAVHADQITMTQFVPFENEKQQDTTGYITIFDAHNATYSIMDRMRQNSAWFLRPILRLETARIKKYEASLIKNFDFTLAVTEQDRELLAHSSRDSIEIQNAYERIQVIPIAADTTSLQPVERIASSHNIMTLGTLHYPPNADGIRWFIKEVFPLIRIKIPDVTLTVIGKNPPADFLKLKDDSVGSINLTGYVQDLRPYLKKAALMVVPVRAGSGMRVRILEAFAWGIPVITTTIGLEGIAALTGDDVLVADEAGDFANEAVRLLNDVELQSTLAKNGRNLVTKLYDWQVVLKKLDEIYHAK